MHTDVAAYVDSAPPEQRPQLEELRGMIRAALPHATEEMSPNGFPVYTLDGHWLAGFATRARGAMFYCMVEPVLDRHAEKLGTLRSGRSCIEYRGNRKLSLDEVRDIARHMLAELAERTS